MTTLIKSTNANYLNRVIQQSTAFKPFTKSIASITSIAIMMICSQETAAASKLEELQHAKWAKAMSNMETPYEGCFQATFPNTAWETVPCGMLSVHSKSDHIRTTANQPGIAGSPLNYVLIANDGDTITQTIGSFPSVSGVTSESSVAVPSLGGSGILGTNRYSLQLNTNPNSATSACHGGSSYCTVWQQFMYATDYETSGSAAVFMQYWLSRYGTNCPSGYTSDGHLNCWKNSPYISAPDVPITSLGNLKLSANAIPGGRDTVTFTNGTRVYSVSASDSILQIGTVWSMSEFNVFGDMSGSMAVFNLGTSITVNVTAQLGSSAAPQCLIWGSGTAESNNLSLGDCQASGGTIPSIQFTESSVSELNAFTLRNHQTGYCLAISGGNLNAGTALIVWPCDGTPSQNWWWNMPNQSWPTSSPSEGTIGWGSLISGLGANWVIGVQNGNNVWNNGTKLVDWEQTSDLNQQWMAYWAGQDFNGHDCYYFLNENQWSSQPKVMGVSGGSRNQGASVVVWSQFMDAHGNPDFYGHPDQYWCVY